MVYEKSQVKNNQTCGAHNKLYPTTTNSNYFALLTQNDDDGVTVVRSNCGQDKIKNDEHTKNISPLPPSHYFPGETIRRSYTVITTQEKAWQETMFNTSNIKIAVDIAVADSGATGHFVLPGTKVSDMKSTQLKSTHTCDIDVPWIPK